LTHRLAVAFVAVCSVVSCKDPAGTAEAEGVRVEARFLGLTIRNDRDSAIYHFAIDRTAVSTTLWVGCGWRTVTDPVRECGPGIRPGEKKDVPVGDIAGWGASPEVIVYWWHLVPGPEGGLVQGTIRHLIVSR
jgi:hypothetical protein